MDTYNWGRARAVLISILIVVGVLILVTGCTTTPASIHGEVQPLILSADTGSGVQREGDQTRLTVQLHSREVHAAKGVQTILEVEVMVENISETTITVDPQDIVYLHISSQRLSRSVTDREFKQVRMVIGPDPVESDSIEIWPAPHSMEYAAFLSQRSTQPPNLDALLEKTELEPGASVTGTVGFVFGGSVAYTNTYEDTDELRRSSNRFSVTEETQVSIARGDTTIDADRLRTAHRDLTSGGAVESTVATFQEVAQPTAETKASFGKQDFYIVYTVEPEWISMTERAMLLATVGSDVYQFSLSD